MISFYLPKSLFWLFIYIVLLTTYQIISYFEHRKYPAKYHRYQALPLRFKLACALIALPIFATSIFAIFEQRTGLSFCWIIAVAIGFWIEIKAVEWYKENGYF